MDGLKFRRQHVIDFFVVDFYCAEAKLVVEVDGPTHERTEDAERDAYLRALGYQVIRFMNDDVLKGKRYVIDRIWDCAMKRRACSNPHPSPLPRRERE
ncbi:MAG TPA: endonuclease domain-containing protein [Phycisphaerae bacterium]|nr:endonuclease domain-containing protein [Phycisphaerae bacterium]